MAEEDKDQRRLPASGRRRQKARDKGQVARSKELSAAVTLAGIVLVIYFGGGAIFSGMKSILSDMLKLNYGREPIGVLKTSGLKAMVLLAPVFVVSVMFAAAGTFMQGGFVMKPPRLDLNRLNPATGIKNRFSLQGLNELVKSFLKFATGILVFYYLLKGVVPKLPALAAMETSLAINTAYGYIFKIVLAGLLWMLVIAFISYVLEKIRFERSIRMTQWELKEERKETEGDPRIKSRIRSIQYQQARHRMMQEVPKATVVITNPTHLAVAIKYEHDMPAPRVVAKGSGFVAQKIKEVAAKNSVPVVEDKPLARMLFKLSINDYIPQELYRAVAKVISYIYKLKGKSRMRKAG